MLFIFGYIAPLNYSLGENRKTQFKKKKKKKKRPDKKKIWKKNYPGILGLTSSPSCLRKLWKEYGLSQNF
ncbi:hypothetical protein NPS74_23530, partial [Cutibacterium acnes subsp. acnes]|nr:hypothetical protein [Cutibacterium acnes subsp. acnes]